MKIDGAFEDRFGAVAGAFERNFAAHGEVGAAVCVYRGGRPVVDLWAGLADRDAGRAWQRDTMVVTNSTTKGFTTTVAHVLVERGLLDLDAPVAAYWPEFAANDKQDIPVRWMLSHRAGIPVLDEPPRLADIVAWAPVVAAVARQKPLWAPGTAHGYHVQTFGWMVGEIVRRITGKTIGRFYADEIASRFGIDFWIGLPPAQRDRVATCYAPPPAGREGGAAPTLRALAGWTTQQMNLPALQQAEVPSYNGIGTARAIARHYAALIGEIDGARILAPQTLAAACAVQSDGPDRVFGAHTRCGLGFVLPPSLGVASGPRSFGHAGSGGSLGFADPAAGVAFGYTPNQMGGVAAGDVRTRGLVDALYRCL
ncbi:MAG TPA: serine hydrolase domain-containing protein [Polyangia bacterium]|jgi:CubicO group peptidase (beta-lactamase class C family)